VSAGALAHAAIVSGDDHLLVLADRLPVYSPANFFTPIKNAR